MSEAVLLLRTMDIHIRCCLARLAETRPENVARVARVATWQPLNLTSSTAGESNRYEAVHLVLP